MTACASFDLEVPRRNLRRWSLVSWEKVYNLASELCAALELVSQGSVMEVWSRGSKNSIPWCLVCVCVCCNNKSPC